MKETAVPSLDLASVVLGELRKAVRAVDDGIIGESGVGEHPRGMAGVRLEHVNDERVFNGEGLVALEVAEVLFPVAITRRRGGPLSNRKEGEEHGEHAHAEYGFLRV